MAHPSRSAPAAEPAADPAAASDPFEVPLNRSFTYRFHHLGKLSDPVSHQADRKSTRLNSSHS